MKDACTTLDYLRHGEPTGGGGRYRGHGIDDPLSEKGWAQMKTTVADLSGWSRIVSSPLSRCQAFAKWLSQQHDLPLNIFGDLREVGFGTWEGATRAELLAHRPDEYHAFQADPVNNRPDGAESLQDFSQRIVNVLDHLIDQYAGEHLLVVAHAGVIRATLGHIIQAPANQWYRVMINHAGLTRFTSKNQNAQLILHNWRPDIQVTP